jgi:cytochrome c oxidase subunit II
MPFQLRPRWLATRGAGAAALTVALLGLSACAGDYPNSVFHSRTEFNRDTDALFQLIIKLGVIVFVLVFALLLVTMWKYRTRPGQREPEHVHGNTTLEILWTVIPALVLVWIAIPTVRTIFRTQAPAPAGALQIEVIGHQWWWEFRYPEYGITTANELYLPKGRTVNFALKTQDVIHSFWIPALGGKRDLIANRTNHIWMTPDSTTEKAFNGACVEYCGASHANMRFRAFVVEPAEFDSWAAHEKSAAVFQLAGAAPATNTTPTTAGGTGRAANAQPLTIPPGGQTPPVGTNQPNVGTERAGPTIPSSGPRTPATTSGPAAVSQAGYYFPAADLPKHVAAYSPIPDGLTIDDAVLAGGDAQRGGALMTSGMGGCVGCHTISGAKNMMGVIGPNLTHIGSRLTIGAGLFPNDAKHMALWIKNARLMKPGITMPTIGKDQIDPQTKKKSTMASLTDQQIADMVAYLRALK